MVKAATRVSAASTSAAARRGEPDAGEEHQRRHHHPPGRCPAPDLRPAAAVHAQIVQPAWHRQCASITSSRGAGAVAWRRWPPGGRSRRPDSDGSRTGSRPACRGRGSGLESRQIRAHLRAQRVRQPPAVVGPLCPCGTLSAPFSRDPPAISVPGASEQLQLPVTHRGSCRDESRGGRRRGARARQHARRR